MSVTASALAVRHPRSRRRYAIESQVCSQCVSCLPLPSGLRAEERSGMSNWATVIGPSWIAHILTCFSLFLIAFIKTNPLKPQLFLAMRPVGLGVYPWVWPVRSPPRRLQYAPACGVMARGSRPAGQCFWRVWVGAEPEFGLVSCSGDMLSPPGQLRVRFVCCSSKLASRIQ